MQAGLSGQAGVSQVSPNVRGEVLPPTPVDLAGAAVFTVYDKAVEGDLNLQYLLIQNVGIGKVKVALNTDATENLYNYILKVDTGAEAGAGGQIELFGAWNISKVTVLSAAGSKISFIKVVSPINSRIQNY